MGVLVRGKRPEPDDFASKLVVRVNNVEVSKEDLLAVAGAVDMLEPNDRDFEGHLFTIGRLHRGDPDRGQAVWFRTLALARFLSEHGAPGWTLPTTPDGCIPAEHSVFAAAAVEPLIVRDNELVFDEKKLLQKVLELAELNTAS